MEPTIIIDTREQTPWEFKHFATSSQKLNTGDYSIEGLEKTFAIERKKSVSEIAQNLREARFLDVMQRLSEIKHRFIICEFSLTNIYEFPIGSNVPKSRWGELRITGKFILKRISELQAQFQVPFIFCDNRVRAEQYSMGLIKAIYEQEQKQDNNT